MKQNQELGSHILPAYGVDLSSFLSVACRQAPNNITFNNFQNKCQIYKYNVKGNQELGSQILPKTDLQESLPLAYEGKICPHFYQLPVDKHGWNSTQFTLLQTLNSFVLCLNRQIFI